MLSREEIIKEIKKADRVCIMVCFPTKTSILDVVINVPIERKTAVNLVNIPEVYELIKAHGLGYVKNPTTGKSDLILNPRMIA